MAQKAKYEDLVENLKAGISTIQAVTMKNNKYSAEITAQLCASMLAEIDAAQADQPKITESISSPEAE